ncbi:hypothetical protein EJ05DRAFT_513181 [Pseudovirgaria hyperparasitica]|uniref:C2H2-type domain-containing protein n=1 Tax=Pseudovirgaria hyperparasitica TaxID=470096 RepID=A0A6A6VYJ0_9PEZI|nr:uncharacterized protein EJ05DRAFT_513181 [Pseudovirgaria hyperparasitica]KAF2755702.1 hypothetical protein EJ05DRAFT_513181 [Pseudovirgaria hyperparasitica]
MNSTGNHTFDPAASRPPLLLRNLDKVFDSEENAGLLNFQTYSKSHLQRAWDHGSPALGPLLSSLRMPDHRLVLNVTGLRNSDPALNHLSQRQLPVVYTFHWCTLTLRMYARSPRKEKTPIYAQSVTSTITVRQWNQSQIDLAFDAEPFVIPGQTFLTRTTQCSEILKSSWGGEDRWGVGPIDAVTFMVKVTLSNSQEEQKFYRIASTCLFDDGQAKPGYDRTFACTSRSLYCRPDKLANHCSKPLDVDGHHHIGKTYSLALKLDLNVKWQNRRLKPAHSSLACEVSYITRGVPESEVCLDNPICYFCHRMFANSDRLVLHLLQFHPDVAFFDIAGGEAGDKLYVTFRRNRLRHLKKGRVMFTKNTQSVFLRPEGPLKLQDLLDGNGPWVNAQFEMSVDPKRTPNPPRQPTPLTCPTASASKSIRASHSLEASGAQSETQGSMVHEVTAIGERTDTVRTFVSPQSDAVPLPQTSILQKDTISTKTATSKEDSHIVPRIASPIHRVAAPNVHPAPEVAHSTIVTISGRRMDLLRQNLNSMPNTAASKKDVRSTPTAPGFSVDAVSKVVVSLTPEQTIRSRSKTSITSSLEKTTTPRPNSFVRPQTGEDITAVSNSAATSNSKDAISLKQLASRSVNNAGSGASVSTESDSRDNRRTKKSGFRVPTPPPGRVYYMGNNKRPLSAGETISDSEDDTEVTCLDWQDASYKHDDKIGAKEAEFLDIHREHMRLERLCAGYYFKGAIYRLVVQEGPRFLRRGLMSELISTLRDYGRRRVISADTLRLCLARIKAMQDAARDEETQVQVDAATTESTDSSTVRCAPSIRSRAMRTSSNPPHGLLDSSVCQKGVTERVYAGHVGSDAARTFRSSDSIIISDPASLNMGPAAPNSGYWETCGACKEKRPQNDHDPKQRKSDRYCNLCCAQGSRSLCAKCRVIPCVSDRYSGGSITDYCDICKARGHVLTTLESQEALSSSTPEASHKKQSAASKGPATHSHKDQEVNQNGTFSSRGNWGVSQSTTAKGFRESQRLSADGSHSTPLVVSPKNQLASATGRPIVVWDSDDANAELDTNDESRPTCTANGAGQKKDSSRTLEELKVNVTNTETSSGDQQQAVSAVKSLPATKVQERSKKSVPKPANVANGPGSVPIVRRVAPLTKDVISTRNEGPTLNGSDNVPTLSFGCAPPEGRSKTNGVAKSSSGDGGHGSRLHPQPEQTTSSRVDDHRLHVTLPIQNSPRITQQQGVRTKSKKFTSDATKPSSQGSRMNSDYLRELRTEAIKNTARDQTSGGKRLASTKDTTRKRTINEVASATLGLSCIASIPLNAKKPRKQKSNDTAAIPSAGDLEPRLPKKAKTQSATMPVDEAFRSTQRKEKQTRNKHTVLDHPRDDEAVENPGMSTRSRDGNNKGLQNVTQDSWLSNVINGRS